MHFPAVQSVVQPSLDEVKIYLTLCHQLGLNHLLWSTIDYAASHSCFTETMTIAKNVYTQCIRTVFKIMFKSFGKRQMCNILVCLATWLKSESEYLWGCYPISIYVTLWQMHPESLMKYFYWWLKQWNVSHWYLFC